MRMHTHAQEVVEQYCAAFDAHRNEWQDLVTDEFFFGSSHQAPAPADQSSGGAMGGDRFASFGRRVGAERARTLVADCTNMQLDCAAVARFDADAALRALAHPHRRRMLQFVADVERPASDLAVRCRVSKPATSQHLKVLREADLVSVRADGNRRLYRARADRVAEVLTILDGFWGGRLAALQSELE